MTLHHALDPLGGSSLWRARVRVVDDHEGFRMQLRSLLEKAGIDVVGEACSGGEALLRAGESRPDVVVMDLHMPGMDGFEATRRIAAADPSARVIVLTMSDHDDDVSRAILAGACGYLLKDVPGPDLLRGIKAALDGESVVSPRITATLIRQLRAAKPEPATRAAAADLSGRELEVLKLVAKGKETSEIASQLHISPKTVKHHISSILMKLRIESRVQAAIFAIRNGIV
jgi:DNA-binding NarL/FixJ family response regulator